MLQPAQAAGNRPTMRIERGLALGRRAGRAALLACLWGLWPWGAQGADSADAGADSADAVLVSVTGFKTDQGLLHVKFYQREGWLKSSAVKRDMQLAGQVSEGTVAIRLEAPPGEYAAMAFHDVNGNGKLDTGFMRRPKEPAGFSNGVVPKFGPPRFKDCAFSLSGQGDRLTIELRDY